MRFRRVLLLPILIVIIVIVFLRLVLVVLRCFADRLLIIIIVGMLVCAISIVKFGFCSIWSYFIWGLQITNCIYYRSIWFSLLNHKIKPLTMYNYWCVYLIFWIWIFIARLYERIRMRRIRLLIYWYRMKIIKWSR